MEKPNNNAIPSVGYYEYIPGYLEKKCTEKLHEIVSVYQSVMDSHKDLRELKKLIEKLDSNFNGGRYDAC